MVEQMTPEEMLKRYQTNNKEKKVKKIKNKNKLLEKKEKELNRLKIEQKHRRLMIKLYVKRNIRNHI